MKYMRIYLENSPHSSLSPALPLPLPRSPGPGLGLGWAGSRGASTPAFSRVYVWKVVIRRQIGPHTSANVPTYTSDSCIDWQAANQVGSPVHVDRHQLILVDFIRKSPLNSCLLFLCVFQRTCQIMRPFACRMFANKCTTISTF